jgi:hypothetical protein
MPGPSKVRFIGIIPLLTPSLLKSTIPENLQISSYLCTGCSIEELENFLEVAEFTKVFEVTGV